MGAQPTGQAGYEVDGARQAEEASQTRATVARKEVRGWLIGRVLPALSVHCIFTSSFSPVISSSLSSLVEYMITNGTPLVARW